MGQFGITLLLKSKASLRTLFTVVLTVSLDREVPEVVIDLIDDFTLRHSSDVKSLNHLADVVRGSFVGNKEFGLELTDPVSWDSESQRAVDSVQSP